MSKSLIDQYAGSLAMLTGDDFQMEVSARLQSMILSFQTVPAKPKGDAGLDGFSHHGTRGYCCYGPEHDAFKSNKARESAIINKFTGDLRRLLELDSIKGKLVRAESPEMATILPRGQHLAHIELIVNWFESHRVLGPILTAFVDYTKLSACRYVNPDASVIVVGPKQLANLYAVDEVTLYRARQRVLMDKVQVIAEAVTIVDSKGFDEKMETLRQIRPHQVPAIDALSDELRSNWRTALALEQELDQTLPMLHRSLENSRRQILARVSELMVASPEPWTQLPRAQDIAKAIIEQGFGTMYGPLIPQVSSGEIARLIGECPVGWKKPQGAHG